ncbi:MAG TPA: DUF1800 domain-containing protein [candidate division Zixibacteria bacterium]|nr:DUF1800 domain-containing protein [candidate division Zixibacteria bacterium]
MRLPRAKAICLILLVLLSVALAAEKRKSKNAKAGQIADERQRAIHALNRLTYGPRPGDVDQVLKIGVDRWIERQLEPHKIDDSALEARLAPFRTLQMSTRELAEKFPSGPMVKAVADGKKSMPRDPDEKAIYEAALARYENRQEKKNEKAAQQADLLQMSPDELTDEKKEQRRAARAAARSRALDLLELTPDQRVRTIEQMGPDERRMFWAALSQQDREQLTADMNPHQREVLLAMENPVAVVNGELMASKLIRATYSERQLEQVMTDFWFNHFNVFIGKGADRYMVTAYERDVIRPHAMGKFKDLLLATAKSPAMLWYLDNWQSVGPNSMASLGVTNPRPRMARCGPFRVPCVETPPPRAKGGKKSGRGLNENYAREVMELHTLGVNGGYTQHDVTELARVLTGWTIAEPRKGGGFEFNERTHEPGTKVVLGHKFHDDGMREGEKALEMLAQQPATARFICTKLAQRFVSDAPPEALIARMAETFHKSDGDIREVLRTMFRSDEFWSKDAYRAKVKTPFEYVVSSLRTTGADIQRPRGLIETLDKMGMPLYGCQPPTGYSMKAESWVNSSALLARMNFVLALTASRLQGVNLNAEQLIGSEVNLSDPAAVQARVESIVLHGDVSAQTHNTITTRLEDPQITGRKLDDTARPVNSGVLIGLILGSPEFQRR